MAHQPRLFSGIQPTGQLHIGNYLGALKQWAKLQTEFEALYCIVDLHSLTEDFNPKEKEQQIFNTAVDILASGVDPEKSKLFIQSQVPEHTELTWILNCITPLAELERMTQYKDKSARQKKNINVGLFDYPVLMAADILLYQAELIPVGEDQLQHIELTKKIAKKFNHKFGEFFELPKAKLTQTARIMSLTNPLKKMSKSEPKSCIFLSDTPEEIQKKISKATTDSGKKDDKISGGRNLLDIFSAFVADENIINKFEEDYQKGELQYSKFKPMLANVISQSLKPIQQKRKQLLQDKQYVMDVLETGRKYAAQNAIYTITEVKKRIGLPL